MAEPLAEGRAAQVLIVGAGALGTALGYHLALGGTKVSFHVRPSRATGFPLSRTLYSYDDGELKTFTGYEVTSTAQEVATRQFDFVVVTLDGAATFSPEGTALLGDLADAIRDSDAVLIACGVGFGLREHVLAATALPDDRVLLGTLAYMCHEPAAALPLHAPTDPLLLARADFAYGHLADRAGFTLARTSRVAARRFAALVERSRVDRCIMVSPAFYAVYTSVFFAFTLASEMAGWPDAEGFSRHPEELALAAAAMKEIAGLSKFGETGRRVQAALSAELLGQMQAAMEAGLRPLDFTAFNRYHHGGKVLAQDVGVLRDCLALGTATGHPIPRLKELLARYDAHCGLAAGAKPIAAI